MPRDEHQVSDHVLVTMLLFNLLFLCSCHNDRSFSKKGLGKRGHQSVGNSDREGWSTGQAQGMLSQGAAPRSIRGIIFSSHLLLGANRERAIVPPPQLLTTRDLLMVVLWKLIKPGDNGN